MPMAWIEAMAQGKAIVASTRGPGPEMVTDGVDGLLADPDDAAALARQLVTLLDDPARRRAMGAAARRTAVARWSAPVALEANVELYRSLAREHR
jgi:glycosyltransferase involved in cell wall biosynthesis